MSADPEHSGKKRKHHHKEHKEHKKDKKEKKARLEADDAGESVEHGVDYFVSRCVGAAASVAVVAIINLLIGLFPGVNVPEQTTFEAYQHKDTKYLIHGETERMEFDGTNSPEEDLYYVGIYDPATESVELVHAPVVTAARTIKAQKKKTIVDKKQVDVQNRIQRNALGEAFGTKKAKRAIDDLARNQIDADKLESFTESIVDNIKASTSTLPSADELAKQESEDRPIPPCKEDASAVEEIYPLIGGLLQADEFKAIRMPVSLLREKSAEKRVENFPVKSSNYINTRVGRIQNEAQVEKLKLLYYAALLIGFYENRRTNNKRMLLAKLNHPPEILVDGLIRRFGESKAGRVGKDLEHAFTVTPKNEDKLLCYLFATCLRIDEYTVEVPLLASELSIRPLKVQELFKALGCKIKPCTAGQKEALGLSSAEAANYKMASLALPFKLPEIARRKRASTRR
ncbi:DNA-directed RNA polymerase I subunit A49 [Myxozyma melibiosi]|uniref:DNA-directed RNA polymerase I subunit A49 n=1 Tax=Myxozyma melibiosi TaxID=54550 RepID=A0ABR1F871_9ASCO